MRQAADAAPAPAARTVDPAVIAALFVGALALRPQLTSIGPLLPVIRAEYGLSHFAAGSLTTIPIVCMALFALPASRLFAAIGARAAVAIALLLVVLAGAVRAFAPDVVSLLVLTALFGVGAGLGGALFPAVVKASVPGAPALATSIYSLGINGAAGLAAALAVPFAGITGSWRGALAIYAVAGAVSLVAWIALSGGVRATPDPNLAVPLHMPWRRRDAWWLAIIFGLQAICFFGLNAWLAASYVERGWDAGAAGWLVALLNLITLPATLLVAVVDKRLSRRNYLLAAAVLLCVSIAGAALLPSGAWLWTTTAAVACGSFFPLTMILTVEVGGNPRDASAVAGLMLGVGYLMAAAAPVVLGAFRDATGSFTAGLWLLAAIAATLIAMCATFRSDRVAA